MAGDDELDAVDEVPKLPRGRGIKLSTPEVFRVLLTAGMLVAVILLARPCGNAVGTFVNRFDNGSGSGAARSGSGSGSGSGSVQQTPSHYVQLKPGMTDDETKAAIEKAKAAAASSGSGSGSAP